MLSSMGMPVTNGFIGELLVLIGAFRSSWLIALPVAFGILFGAVYLLWLFQRVFLGNYKCSINNLKDLDLRECVTIIPLIILIFWIGLYPKPFLKTMDASLKHFLKKVEINYKIAASYGEKEKLTFSRETDNGKEGER
jgi:NADH-quinone oxidoreductase subunit M